MRKTIKIQATHKVRINNIAFDEFATNKKSSMIIENNRNYEVGERIIFLEFSGGHFTGKEIVGAITKIESYPEKKGFITLSFRKFSIITDKAQKPSSSSSFGH